MASRPKAARLATFLIFLCNGFGFGAWAAAIPPLKIALGLSASALSVALLAVAIGAVVMMQFAGTLVARFGGTGRTTRLAAFVYIAAAGLPTLAPNLAVLVLATAFLGAVSGLMDVAMNAHAAMVEKQWGAPIMSSFHAGFSLGGLIGTAFGAFLIAAGVPTDFLLPVTAGIIAVVIGYAAPRLGQGDVRSHSGVVLQLPERKLLPLALIAACCFLVEGAMADWGGVYLTTIGISAAAAASGYAAFSLCMVSGRFGGDWMIKHFGRQRVVIVGAVMAALGLTASSVWPHFWVVVPGFALVGLGLANVVPSVFSDGARLGKTAAGGIAAVSTLGYGGMLAGPPLIGAVASAFTLRIGVAVMAAFALLAVLFSFCVRRQNA